MILKNVEKKEKSTAVFTVETSAEEFEKAVNDVYRKNRASINIPGFRKGKAPRALIESMYGKEVFYQDAMDELAPDAYEFGVKEGNLDTVGQPGITNLDITDERTVVYTFDVSLYPEVTLGEYKGLEAEKNVTPVSDEDIEERVSADRKRNARIVTIDDRPAQMGDTANIDFDGFLNGERFNGGKAEGHDLELGSNSFVPGFEEQIVGMQIGEEKDLDITFPENYTPELAGKAVVFKVKLNSLSVKELPELDDDFAQDVSEFETLEEYRENIRKDLTEQRQESADKAFEQAVISQAAKNITAEIPDVMVDYKIEEILRNYAAQMGVSTKDKSFEDLKRMFGFTDENMDNGIRPAALEQVRTELMLEAVGEAEELADTDEAFEEYVKKTADEVGAEPELVKKYFGEDALRNEFRRELAKELVVSSAVVKEGKAE